MTAKQIMRIHTANGVEDIVADRLLVQGDEYVLFRGEDEVRRVPIADILSETDPETGEKAGGIETVYSRS
jgi:hypothetical protein